MKKLISFSFALSLFVLSVNAQFPGGGGGPGGPGSGMGGSNSGAKQQGFGGARLSIGRVYGKVVDAKTKKGIDYASVALYTMAKDSLVGGQLTQDNGDFSLDNLPFGAFKLKITYLGYTAIEQKIIVTPKALEQDIGNIAMSEDEKVLKEVNITAEKATIELKPDRKVFNVEKDLSARGGTGVDVMKNIPGVSTDADGNVTLRNNSPIIYVDGKPTTLTLDQIPADQIEKVEVITNPSAKFEAASTGGIINVVLKKNQKPGYNGMASMSLGTNDQYNGMALINVRERKFGFMLSYNINGSTNVAKSYTDRQNLDNGATTSYFRQDDLITNKRMFQNARLGFDYYVNNRNTISLSQNMTFGKFTTKDAQIFSIKDSLKNDLSTGDRENDQDAGFRNFTTDLNIHHTYPKADKEWTLDFNYNRSKGNTNYNYTTDNYDANGVLLPFNPQIETNNGGQHTNMITAQWDFTTPIGKNGKLDFGVRANYQRQYSFQNIQDLDTTGEYVPNPFLSSKYQIDNLINAAYVTWGQTIKSFSYQIGLRFEQSWYRGILLDHDNASFSYAYPSSGKNLYDMLFPSINLSEKFNDKHELQFNITRKIRRPNFFQLNPFVFSSDRFNYTIGNPQLQPEFDNKAELNYDLTLDKFTLLSSIYGTFNQQPITQYTYTEPGDSLVLINTFVNGKNSFSYGWENTVKVTPVKGLDLTADGNVYYTSITSNVSSAQIQNSGVSWSIKGIISYKFPLGFGLQVNGTYESPRIIPQGHTLPMYFFDASISKDIMSFISLNLTVSDVLNSHVHGTYYDTPTYIQTSTRRRDVRFARLGITIKFGKMDASIFKAAKKAKKEMPQQNEDLGF